MRQVTYLTLSHNKHATRIFFLRKLQDPALYNQFMQCHFQHNQTSLDALYFPSLYIRLPNKAKLHRRYIKVSNYSITKLFPRTVVVICWHVKNISPIWHSVNKKDVSCPKFHTLQFQIVMITSSTCATSQKSGMLRKMQQCGKGNKKAMLLVTTKWFFPLLQT